MEWTTRLAALLSVGERIQRFKCLAPGHLSNGTPYLRVAECLRIKNPDVFSQVTDFAMDNYLTITTNPVEHTP